MTEKLKALRMPRYWGGHYSPNKARTKAWDSKTGNSCSYSLFHPSNRSHNKRSGHMDPPLLWVCSSELILLQIWTASLQLQWDTY